MARDQLLARCSGVSEENLRRFEEFAAQVSSHQTAWQPAHGKWSVAECVERLNLSLELYIGELGADSAAGAHAGSHRDRLTLDRVRLPIPASRMLRITGAEGFRIQARHIPRHLSQAEAVTRRPDFPGSLPYALL